jgi:hypothetical protein
MHMGVGLTTAMNWTGRELLRVVQTDSETHPTSHPVSTVGSFCGERGKVKRQEREAGTLTSYYCRGPEYEDVYIHSPILLHIVALN